MQQSRIVSRSGLGSSKAYGWIVWIVVEYYHKGTAAGPTILVHYFLYDSGYVRGLVCFAYNRPILRLPHHLRCSSGPVADIIGDVFKNTGIGTQFTIDDKVSGQRAFNFIHCELNIRFINSGTLRYIDFYIAQTYYLPVWKLQITTVHIHTS